MVGPQAPLPTGEGGAAWAAVYALISEAAVQGPRLPASVRA